MNWYKIAKHSYSWIGAELPKKIANKIQKWGKENIPNDILYRAKEFGRELETHITVKYGLTTDNYGIIKELFKDEKPIKARLGKIGFFKANSDFDVVIIKVDSKDLHKINEKINNNLNDEDKFDVYKPHCTIAYVKKGEAAKYAGDDIFDGEEIIFDELVFNDYNDNRTKIKLNN